MEKQIHDIVMATQRLFPGRCAWSPEEFKAGADVCETALKMKLGEKVMSGAEALEPLLAMVVTELLDAIKKEMAKKN